MNISHNNAPILFQVKRSLSTGVSIDVDKGIDLEWERLNLDAAPIFSFGRKNNQRPRIALGVGSRGIQALPIMVRKLVERINQAGGDPFIVPAMGSHGGATAAGQLEVLKSLGITERDMGCSLKATMDTVILGYTEDGLPAYLDANAAQAEGIILINRVKMHTSFHGPLESGLHKMLAIGLGKEKGATLLHSRGTDGLRDDMPRVAKLLLQKLPFVVGFGVVEDGAHNPVRVRGFTSDDIESGERELLVYSKTLSPTLPFSHLDVLIVNKMGKDISGTGMDTNIIGRLRIPGKPEPITPTIKAIVVLDLTEGTHGNALGMGLADFTTQTLAEKVDMPLTQKNVVASGFLERGKLPTVLPNAAAALNAALDFAFPNSGNPILSSLNFDRQQRATIQVQPMALRKNARILRIESTLDLETFWVSENLLPEARLLPGFLEESAPEGFV